MDNRKSQRTNRRVPSSFRISREVRRDLRISRDCDLRFFEGYLHAVLKDSHLKLHRLYGKTDYLKDCERVTTRLKSEGAHFVTHVLPILMTDLLNLLEGRQADFPGFSLKKGKNYPRFLRRLFSIVLSGYHDDKVEATALRSIYMISVSFKKLRGDYNKDILKQQYEEFETVDALLEDIDLFSDEVSPIIENARSRWSVFAHNITLNDESCLPRPGPGATVDNVPKSMRYAPHVLFTQLDKVFPYEDWFYSHPWDIVTQSRKYGNLVNSSRTQPYSEYLFVPKTAGKPRGICKETNEAQFFQQALRSLLAYHIDLRLAKHLPLDDQSVHGQLAKAASVDRVNATIDESEASDRIARTLVSWLSQDNVELHDALMAVSTRLIKPPRAKGHDAPLLKTHKFAPMGSGVCFPVMSMVHLFLIQAIISTKMVDITTEERQDFIDRISVYGDDIVIPSQCIPAVYEWLPRFGMKINQDKSFIHSYFRESCGTHAFKGHIVTPVYIKYTNTNLHPNMSETQLISLLQSESQLHRESFHSTAKFLRQQIQTKWNKTILPYVCNNTALLGFLRPSTFKGLTRFHSEFERRKWDCDLQCYTYRVPVLKVRSVSGIIKSPCEAYLRNQCTDARTASKYRGEKVTVPFLGLPPGGMFPSEQLTEGSFLDRWDVLDSVLGLKASRTYLPESLCYNAVET